MSDIKLFKTKDKVHELISKPVEIEKKLQNLIESNMQSFFNIRFVCSEFSTTNGGRIDSLGLDEDNCPVIFEYKRSINENVINQGLFYLDWLLDHKADYEKLVVNAFGKEYFDKVDWSVPRLICIAADFTKYDEYAVKQINRNIELIRYRIFEDDLILFERVNYNSENKTVIKSSTSSASTDKTFEERLEGSDKDFRNLYLTVRDYILSLGDDIQEKQLKVYVAFKRIKNFACVDITPKNKQIFMSLKLNPEEEQIIDGFTKDVSKVGHWGTGDLQVIINNINDFEKAKPLIQKSYENS